MTNDDVTVLKHTYRKYHAEYLRDGDELPYEIYIERRIALEGLFYIEVYHPSGCMSYDGYWKNEHATMDDAIAEALAGSMLVET